MNHDTANVVLQLDFFFRYSFGLMLQLFSRSIHLHRWPQNDSKMNGFFYGAVADSDSSLCQQGTSFQFAFVCVLRFRHLCFPVCYKICHFNYLMLFFARSHIGILYMLLKLCLTLLPNFFAIHCICLTAILHKFMYDV